MKLQNFFITNYRSLKKVEASFDERDLLMILGRNDIGKSNILYAMRIFFNDKKISFDDFKNNGNEDIVLEAHLRRKNGEVLVV